MKKITNFLKNHSFYLAIGVICIGALAAIFIMPNKDGNVKNEANPYAKNEITDATDLSELPKEGVIIVDEDDLDQTDATSEITGEEELSEPVINEENAEVEKSAITSENNTDDVTAEVTPETFDSTTASITSEPFFADGDTFAWPVEGSVVVPYTDESTKHWFSESLNQTMRTFGICISAEEGTEVKAIAKGTVTEIVEDSSTYLDSSMPYVGKLMVIDHGNGYVSMYGFQNGTVNEDLVGQVVNTGDVLGTVGSPKGAFISLGDNIYLQVMHNDKVINPLNYLDLSDQAVKEDSVDIGFAE
ncbi:MAG: peptidoglycan DD-metalloendopeptidase family protein [Candidatus Cellulosilyticum pullistercoris]|uniref:Peptidoglycan DD-metalloendopeptidase family protein n=1 Tax=Candidatus Cellulosilyticum pullistercoris TaxID=2838521 RepID=A0A9E2NME1_9FIRM|nr:peptidoglycan DD-metalloendopeptidase family protein [Candidatus Cellulosilyticum pullistercoris]